MRDIGGGVDAGGWEGSMVRERRGQGEAGKGHGWGRAGLGMVLNLALCCKKH